MPVYGWGKHAKPAPAPVPAAALTLQQLIDQMFRAIERGRAQDVKALLAEARQTPNFLQEVLTAIDRRNNNRTVLHTAAIFGNREIVQDLLSAGANPLDKDTRGYIPLHNAARGGHSHAAQLLLGSSGVGVNEKTKWFKETPLHLLCDKPSFEEADVHFARMLLLKNADVNALDFKQQTPLHIAARFRTKKPLLELLLQYGADSRLRTNTKPGEPTNETAQDIVRRLYPTETDLIQRLTPGPPAVPPHLMTPPDYATGLRILRLLRQKYEEFEALLAQEGPVGAGAGPPSQRMLALREEFADLERRLRETRAEFVEGAVPTLPPPPPPPGPFLRERLNFKSFLPKLLALPRIVYGKYVYTWSMCPICLAMIQDPGGSPCLYHVHECINHTKNQRLWMKYAVQTKTTFCYECGRACFINPEDKSNIFHFALTHGDKRGEMAELPTQSQIPAEWVCMNAGGGGRREMVARVIAMIDAINAMKGPIEDTNAFYTQLTDAGEEGAMNPKYLEEAEVTLGTTKQFPRDIRDDIRFAPEIAPQAPGKNAAVAQVEKALPGQIIHGFHEVLLPEGGWIPMIVGLGHAGRVVLEGLGGVVVQGIRDVQMMCVGRSPPAKLGAPGQGGGKRNRLFTRKQRKHSKRKHSRRRL